MYEFKRVVINTLAGPTVRQGMTELEHLGADGWQIKAAVRNVTGNSEVVYLEREIEDEE
jgi:hypothetical protein